jgi:hypothetical protein
MKTLRREKFKLCYNSIHLLYHLNNPSAANLPCLGLQQQTGPKISSSVEAAGFLPGVLSFLCALAHLQRIAHRSKNLPRNPALRGHTTNGKTDTDFSTGSTMAKWLRVTASRQRSHAQA